MMSQPAMELLKQLAAEGVSPWLAAGGPEFLPGALYRPTGASLLHGAVVPDADPDAARRACDTLWDVFLTSGGRHGRVSVPVDPRVAHDAQALLAEARALRAAVGRPNLLVRVPATAAGLAALADCLAEGISVDADLVFSAERYDEVLTAYLTGLERALAAGRPLHETVAVTSVPVGTLDTEVDTRLAGLPAGPDRDGARNTAAAAVARLMYRTREERMEGDWWRVLRAAGAVPPGLLWTAVEPRHIGALVGWNTGQAATADVLEEAVATGGLSGDTLLNAHEDGRKALALLEDLGIRMAEVTEVLETMELTRLQHAWKLSS
ncbi:transaldolase family protein [Streptomyces sp. NPDC012888]|uniref:transaldolase family protein n=1 Tax=Streptomyces sp. NPDC012888 TaxID=3364855 RepID=UPI00367BF3E2